MKPIHQLILFLLLWPLAGQAAGYAVRAWGDNSLGQLEVPPSLTNAIAVTGGLEHSLALREDGTVIGWGSNSAGQLDVPAQATNIIAIAAGYFHGLALRADGVVIGWGCDTNDQIRIPAGATNVTAIAAGPHSSFALRADGTVVGWGQNQYGQTNTDAAGTTVMAMDCGYHGLALQTNGTVIGWGYDFWGQANGAAAGSNIVAIAAGTHHSLALTSEGTVFAWGRNFEGQTNTPPGLSNVVAVAAGLEHSMALKNTGQVVVWGRNANHETNLPSILAREITVAIASGVSHCLALTKPDDSVLQATVPVPRLMLTANLGPTDLEYQESPGLSDAWLELDEVTITNTPQVYLDDSAIGQPQRFYRLRSTSGPLSLHLETVPRLSLVAEVGYPYRLEFRNATAPVYAWSLLSLVTITNSPQIFYDGSGVGQPPRVYRLTPATAP